MVGNYKTLEEATDLMNGPTFMDKFNDSLEVL
jgi:hypothetical protein